MGCGVDGHDEHVKSCHGGMASPEMLSPQTGPQGLKCLRAPSSFTSTQDILLDQWDKHNWSFWPVARAWTKLWRSYRPEGEVTVVFQHTHSLWSARLGEPQVLLEASNS